MAGGHFLGRFLKHLLLPQWWVLRAFPAPVLQTIQARIAESETTHAGELRFVVEGGLPVPCLFAGQTPRARAIDLFSSLRVWDTAGNSGVLIYVQLVDRRVEIVADRGIDARLGAPFWAAVCRRLEGEFRAGRFEAGALAAIAEIGAALAAHFPAGADNANELPDAPLVL